MAVLLSSGCFVPKPPLDEPSTRPAIAFRDVSRERGIDFHWGPTGKTPLSNLESFGHGCAFLDFDRDGWLDVLLIAEPRCRLYRNDGRGHFRDVTAAMGLDAVNGAWKGCAVGDINGDGWPDLYLSGFRTCALLLSEQGSRFTDMTRAAGLKESGWGSSALLADLDGDTDLDLVVGHYVRIDGNSPRYCTLMGKIESGCPPSAYEAERTLLYENDGDGTYRDVSREAGLGVSEGKTLALSACDYDQDGDLDLYLANDGVPGNHFRNDGNLRFTDVGLLTGTAYGNHDRPQAGMGVDWADYDGDGDWDLVVTAFSHETYSLYRNDGSTYSRSSDETGVADATKSHLGFGVRFGDFDGDGWPDLLFANGHVYDRADEMHADSPFRQPLLLLRNLRGRYEPADMGSDPEALHPIVGRGLATGDFDNDGYPDILAVDREGRARLLHNESGDEARFIGLAIEGPTGPGAAAGATVLLRSDAGTQIAQVAPYGSYLSSSDERVLLGLRNAKRVDSIEIRWTDGARKSLAGLPPGGYRRIRHPRAHPENGTP